MKKVTRLPTAAKRPVRNPGPATGEEGNVRIGQFNSNLPLPAGRILRPALKADLKEVMVIGYDRDNKFYFAGTHTESEKIIFLLERAKAQIMQNVMEDSND